MVDYYYNKLNGRLFTKNSNEWPKYGIGGLRYRSEYSLKSLLNLEIGDLCVINGILITRVK